MREVFPPSVVLCAAGPHSGFLAARDRWSVSDLVATLGEPPRFPHPLLPPRTHPQSQYFGIKKSKLAPSLQRHFLSNIYRSSCAQFLSSVVISAVVLYPLLCERAKEGTVPRHGCDLLQPQRTVTKTVACRIDCHHSVRSLGKVRERSEDRNRQYSGTEVERKSGKWWRLSV